jgi:isopenicillin N synthase-like dioxygenase
MAPDPIAPEGPDLGRTDPVPAADVATVQLGDLRSDHPDRRGAAARAFGDSLVATGFVKVAGAPIDADVLDAAYAAARAVFALPRAELDPCVRPELHGARGLVPFGREKAKDASVADLKEFWHVGPEGVGPANVWPAAVPAFRTAMTALHIELERTAELLLEALAEHLGLARRHLADLVVGADSILRVLHYPPVDGPVEPGAVRSAAHEDINFITLLPAATDDGLQLRDRDGRWCRVDAEPGELVVDSGDQLSRYLNGRIPATTHRVVAPADPTVARYSMPFFCQPRPEVVLAVPAELVEPDEELPPPITAGELHAERLAAIRAGRR